MRTLHPLYQLGRDANDNDTNKLDTKHASELTFGQKIADAVAATMGSWTFIISQSVILAFWIVVNVIAWISHWDPYPFILLNLALSFQAAYAAPFIMISQNRQAERDRHQAEEDYRTNVEAEQRIERLNRSNWQRLR